MADLYIVTTHTNDADLSTWLALGYEELVETLVQITMEDWGFVDPLKIPDRARIEEEIQANGITGYSPDGGDEYFLIWKLNKAKTDSVRLYLNHNA